MKIVDQSLNQNQALSGSGVSIRRQLFGAMFALILGAISGFLAKYFDQHSPLLGSIGTSLGVWILMASLLAAWSRSAKTAALRVLLFFAAMLSAYYLYTTILFGAFPQYYFLAWGLFALLSPVGAMIVWQARGDGWLAAFCASLPVAILLVEGRPFFYTGSLPMGFDILAAVFLAMVLGRDGKQRFRIVLVALVVFLIFWKLRILSLVGWVIR